MKYTALVECQYCSLGTQEYNLEVEYNLIYGIVCACCGHLMIDSDSMIVTVVMTIIVMVEVVMVTVVIWWEGVITPYFSCSLSTLFPIIYIAKFSVLTTYTHL